MFKKREGPLYTKSYKRQDGKSEKETEIEWGARQKMNANHTTRKGGCYLLLIN